MTPSEQLVFDLCKRSALSLWSYPNPRRVDGRELCDVLVVFGGSAVIFSVKEIALNEQADPAVSIANTIDPPGALVMRSCKFRQTPAGRPDARLWQR